MPWFKIDDKHHDHKKTRKALRGVPGKRRDAGAMGLWELAGSWSADNLMDGFVPTDELFRWDDDWEVLSRRLVDAGYWEPAERDGENGFHFVNWDEHQPMKADVEAKREAAKERMRNLRSGSRSRSSEVRANEPENLPGSSSTPSRPVPSRPDPKEVVADKAPKSASRKRPATRLPDDWKPSEQHWEKRHDGIDVEREAQAFRLHAEANDRRQANWNAAFSQWLLRARPSATVHQLRIDDQGQAILPPLPSRSPWGDR